MSPPSVLLRIADVVVRFTVPSVVKSTSFVEVSVLLVAASVVLINSGVVLSSVEEDIEVVTVKFETEVVPSSVETPPDWLTGCVVFSVELVCNSEIVEIGVGVEDISLPVDVIKAEVVLSLTPVA